MKKFFFLILSVCTIYACESDQFKIKGAISDAMDLSVYLDKVNPISNTNNVVAQGKTDASGSFSIPLEVAPVPGLYRVRVGAKYAFVILDGSEKSIDLSGTLKDLGTYQYSINGSTQSKIFAEKMAAATSGQLSTQALSDYAKTDASPLVGMLIGMRGFQDVKYADLHSTLSKKLSASLPGDALSTEYANYANALNREYQRQQSLAKVGIGQPAPEIALPGIDGRERKLSDLKGNVVLLDFWASWCRPCRRENPNVVRVYDKFKDDGFTVFSVSLDGIDSRMRKRIPESQLDTQMRSQKTRWVNAIKKDQLKWDHHVSDLKKWESTAAATYGVTSIPRTFLLDREGNIAVINPRSNLESAVRNLL